ncbi:MAG TPA: hypothetical protein VKE74_14600, partial [Gemmataceae bacterium]|nr:hypothetical protein [Gemmataceae bacterium]
GVDLDTKLGGGALQFPVVAAEPAVVSPPNVLDISATYPQERPGAYLQGIFTNPHHTKVGVRVHGRGGQPSPQTGTTTLQAFDLSGTLVGSTTEVAPGEPGNGFILLEVTSSAANIARFVVESFNALISLDDLTFDELTAAPGPDFAVVATAAQLPVGGSGSTSVFLRRFNGSSGDVRFELSNLPQGVAVASETVNPISGPDGASSIVTLSADASAQPVQNWPVSVTGFPSATAGQFGPHSSTFLLTILDAYDAQVVGIEVTQAIQPYDLPTGSTGNRPLHGTPVRYNGMPLAAGGRTVVRVFPNLALFPAVTSVPDFFCSLSGTRDGAPLPGGPIQTGPGPNPLVLGANFVGDLTRARGKECDFILPEDWTHGVISLTARISPVPSLLPPTSVDCCPDNDSFTLTDIAFTPTRDLFFAPFALRVNGGPLGFPDDIFSDARNLLPLGETQFHMGDFAGEIDITDIWNQDVKACGILGLGSCPEDETGRGASVAARLRDFADEMNFTESGELVVGIFPQSNPDRIRGLEQSGCTGPFWDCDDLQVAVVQNQGRPLTSVAHELGHRLGRPHASFACGAGDVDNNGPAEHWPPPDTGFIQGVGVDRRSLQVRFPDRTGGQLGGPFYDFMSYCANNSNDPDSWISLIGWNESIAFLETGPPGSSMPVLPARASRRVTAGALRPVLVVQGFADLQGNISVTKIAEYLRPPRPAPSSSHFEVVVHTPGGTVLGRQLMETVLGIAHNLPGTVKFLSAEIPA